MVFDIFKVLQSNAKQGILLLPHISNLSLITASLNCALKESPAYYTLHGFLENISKQTNLKDRRSVSLKKKSILIASSCYDLWMPDSTKRNLKSEKLSMYFWMNQSHKNPIPEEYFVKMVWVNVHNIKTEQETSHLFSKFQLYMKYVFLHIKLQKRNQPIC